MMENIEDRIRRRAYEIWEQEGRPHGRETDHWLRAAQEIAVDAGRPATERAAAKPKAGAANPQTRTRKTGAKEPGAEPAGPAGTAAAKRTTARPRKAGDGGDGAPARTSAAGRTSKASNGAGDGRRRARRGAGAR